MLSTTRGFEGKNDNDAFETKIDIGIQERRKVYDGWTSTKDEMKALKMGSNCAVSSPATALEWDWDRAHSSDRLLGPNWKEIWEPRKIAVNGWVTEWLKRQITGLDDDKVREVLEQFSRIMTVDAKTSIHWTHSKENQGPWLKKTMVCLWLISGTIKGRMIDVLKL